MNSILVASALASGQIDERLHYTYAPAEAFWSLTLYDTTTRSMIQAPSNDAARSSLDKLKTNADGSIDLYFGPAGSAPKGLEASWIETLPGKGFYPMMRFYSPKACSTGRGSCRTSKR